MLKWMYCKNPQVLPAQQPLSQKRLQKRRMLEYQDTQPQKVRLQGLTTGPYDNRTAVLGMSPVETICQWQTERCKGSLCEKTGTKGFSVLRSNKVINRKFMVHWDTTQPLQPWRAAMETCSRLSPSRLCHGNKKQHESPFPSWRSDH